MSDRIEIQGKTVEAAVSEALLQMGARRDEVEIKVLEEPKAGFMGFLGGRAARVLVRKKHTNRSRGGQDHRVDDGDYQAHNLGNGSGSQRRGSRRPPSGNSPKESTDNRQASRQPEREEKSGSRRGSRGRGGRGRSRGASARDQKPDQSQGQRSNQRSGQKAEQRSEQRSERRSEQRPEQAKGPKSVQKPNQRPSQTPDPKPSQKQAQATDRKPDKRRGRPGLGSGRKNDQTRTPRERTKPAAAAREDSTAREEVPIRPLKQEPVQSSPAPAVPVMQEETKPITPKEEVTVSKPVKQRRAFGGLGSRIKKKQEASQAPETGNPAAEGSPAASETRTIESTSSTPTPRGGPSVSSRPAAPPYERRPRERRAPSYASGHGGEELVLGGIKGTKYAKRIDAVTEEGLDEALTELTDALLARAGFPCQCETFPGEYRQIKVTTDEDNAGMLIGRHGQTVDAVEHLVERMASNAIDARARINLDINDYRMRREEMLSERVAEVAEKIRETGRPFHMEPMSGRERRIVHLETEALGGLRTFTMDGSGGKHVVIALENEASQDEEVAGDGPMVDNPSEGVDELNDSDT